MVQGLLQSVLVGAAVHGDVSGGLGLVCQPPSNSQSEYALMTEAHSSLLILHAGVGGAV